MRVTGSVVCRLGMQDTMLQVCAVTCLCKLMCVSSEFCEANLQLLFTLLEKSPLEVVRANIAIAVGDMAICFNRYVARVGGGVLRPQALL